MYVYVPAWPHACIHTIYLMIILIIQVVGPTDDGNNYDDADAALRLDLGTPRYVPE